jgi:hypothetical protein
MIEATALVEKFKQALSEHWGYIWGTAGVEWTQAKQNQKISNMVGKYGSNWQKNADAKSDNYYMAALYGAKWIGHTVSDCSGLFSWAYRCFGEKIYHGSNSIYDRYCSEKGKITDGIRKNMKPGTAVFVCKSSGNKSHIGLYVGNGKVIEAEGTQAGVCTSNVTAGKWTYYGLLKDVRYSASDAPVSPSVPADDKTPDQTFPTLKKGSKGEYVTLLQTKLIQKGYDLGRWGADGDFGSQTEKAVKQFQKDHGLTADGIVGARTWAALDESSTNLYTVTIPHLPKYKAEALIKDYSGSSMIEERG